MVHLKLWILYDDPFGYCQLIAENLSDLLEHIVDSNVGKVKKLPPNIISEEKPDLLMIGAPIFSIHSAITIKNWINKFREANSLNGEKLKKIFLFSITHSKIDIKSIWLNLFDNTPLYELIFPNILHVDISAHESIFDVLNELKRSKFLKQTINQIKKLRGEKIIEKR
ncbi:MAG: hypothetical protein BAJALOKI1v1_600020 [Promethearchaeota archaeon]|nr:MAG: hypothetical protein BAJALOKI1v1_600020 [Candidatus Lokiarchaeota archaeon]